jgi:hypothetical protein
VMELDVADGVVQTIRGVVNPDKLRHLGPVSDVARLPEKELARGIPAAPPGAGRRSGGPPAGRHRRTESEESDERSAGDR